MAPTSSAERVSSPARASARRRHIQKISGAENPQEIQYTRLRARTRATTA